MLSLYPRMIPGVSWRSQWVVVLLLISMVLTPLIPLLPPPSLSRPVEEAGGATAAPAAPDLLAYPELVEQREEHARHYELGDGRFVAVVGVQPINYRDASGAWQPIDARFARVGEGWQVRRNSLQSFFEARGTTVRLIHRDALMTWQPRMVEARSAGDTLLELATPLPPASAAPGVLDSDGLTLRYDGAWSEPALVERFHSGAGWLEQELVLAQPPQAVAGPNG